MFDLIICNANCEWFSFTDHRGFRVELNRGGIVAYKNVDKAKLFSFYQPLISRGLSVQFIERPSEVQMEQVIKEEVKEPENVIEEVVEAQPFEKFTEGQLKRMTKDELYEYIVSLGFEFDHSLTKPKHIAFILECIYDEQE